MLVRSPEGKKVPSAKTPPGVLTDFNAVPIDPRESAQFRCGSMTTNPGLFGAVAAGQFTTYKDSRSQWSLLGAVMQGWLLLQLLILVVVANGTAVVAKKLLGTAFGRPLDGGAVFVDGQPIFGPSKTIRGVMVSVFATSISAALMGLGWGMGVLIATFAMAGDLFSSFVKRRLRLGSSSMAIGLDHIPESLFPLLASRLLLPLSIFDVVAGVTIFVIGALILSPLLFKLNLRDKPY
jgi:hypothetical protein